MTTTTTKLSGNWLVCLLAVALIVVTQLLESISVTKIVESSLFIQSSTPASTTVNRMNEFDGEHWTTSQSSTTLNDLTPQRRSTIHESTTEQYDDEDDDDSDGDDDNGETASDQNGASDDDKDASDRAIATTAARPLTTADVGSTTPHEPVSVETATAASIPTSHNRTLVIVLGNVRGGTPAWKSMIREVLDPNRADLALLIGAGDVTHPPTRTLLHERAKYIWTVPEFDDWADAMEDIPNKPHDWRERVFGRVNATRKGNILLGAAHNISGSGALVFMFRFYLSQKLVEHNLLAIYNRFVVTRSDHYYLCVHDLSELSNDYLWVPGGSDHVGICDRHFIASNETILPALDILPPLVRNPEAYAEQIQTYPYNTERFLLLRWNQEGLGPRIQRFNRTMFLVASSDDQTRWKPKGRYIENLDVYLKYSQEYRLSNKSCRWRRMQKIWKAKKQQQKQKQKHTL